MERRRPRRRTAKGASEGAGAPRRPKPPFPGGIELAVFLGMGPDGVDSGIGQAASPRAVDLSKLATFFESVEGVWRSALHWGDRVIVVTLNSVYTLCVGDDETFVVSGGWFDRNQSSPTVVRVAGCTWGGSAINRRLVAAPGLHLEFANGVVTTEIQRVIVARYDDATDNPN